MALLVWIPALLLFAVGVVLLVRPGWCVELYVRWYALFGVDLNRVITSRSRLALSMRIGGVACLLAATLMLIGGVVVFARFG